MRRRAHNIHVKRQLPPILSGVLGGTILPTLPGPLGSVTSIIPIPTLSFPNSATTTTTDLPLSSISISSSSSSSETSTSSISPSSESSSETPATPTSTPTPSVVQTVFETTSGGAVHTVTTLVDSIPSATQSVVPPTPPKSFLQNKVLSGVIFALIGIVGLAIILAIVTFAIRRKRKSRLLKDAISFDPTSMTDNHHHGFSEDRGSLEKRSVLTSSNEHIVLGPAEHGDYTTSRAYAHSDSSSYPYGQDPNLAPRGGYPYSKPPPALAHEYIHGPDRALPEFPRSEGINWGPSLTPFTVPFGSPDPHLGASTDERAQSQNRLLKVTND